MEDVLRIFTLTTTDALMIGASFLAFLIFQSFFKKLFAENSISLIEAREASSSGALLEAHQLHEKALEITKHYEAEILKVTLEESEKSSLEIAKARKESEEILSATKAKVDADVKDARIKLLASFADQRSQAVSHISSQGLVDDLIARIRHGFSALAKNSLTFYIPSATALSLLSSNVAFASGGGAQFEPYKFGILWVNFLIFAFILYWKITPILSRVWSERREKLQADLDNGASRLKSARKEFQIAQEKLGQLSQDSELIRKKWATMTHSDIGEMRRATEKEVAVIESRAKSLIDAESVALKARLKVEFVSELLDTLKTKAKREISDSEDRGFRANGIKNLSSELLTH